VEDMMLEGLNDLFIYALIMIPFGITVGYLLEKWNKKNRWKEKEKFLDEHMDKLERNITKSQIPKKEN